jgi:hypothetical protein
MSLEKIAKLLRYEDLCTFMAVSHSVLLRMADVSDKSCRENRNTHFTRGADKSLALPTSRCRWTES